MTDDIILSRHSQDNRLREFIKGTSKRRFVAGAELSKYMSAAVQVVSETHDLRVPEVLEAITTTLVAAVQCSLPATEWADTAKVLAEQVQRRLMVRQD